MKKFILDSKKIVLLLLIISILPSCEDWLEVAPEKDLIKDNYWKKTEDIDKALAATYNSLRSSSLNSLIWGELRADIITGFPGDFAPIANSEINPKNYVIQWTKYYETINLANTLMYYADQVMQNDKSFTKEMRDAVDAEALFLRSLSYFNLVRLWKNVPLVLRPSISDTSNFYIAQSSESQIIKQITSDLLVAKDKAYTKKYLSNPRYFKGRANKYSIMTLLADVYLWSEQYDNCIKYCDEVINSGLYRLEENNNWFKIYNPGNSSESIFEIQCLDDGSNDQINPMFKGQDKFYSEYSYGTKLIDPSAQSGPKNPVVNNKFGNLFNDQIDKRSNSNNILWKYCGASYSEKLTRNNTQEDLNMIVYRYADILLMKAEALNELDRLVEAESFATQTYERAGYNIPITDVPDKFAMRDIILDERAKEFYYEGKRWFDLLRFAKRNKFQNKELIMDVINDNAPATSVDAVKSMSKDTNFYYLPVNYNELRRNKNLKQNPFYLR